MVMMGSLSTVSPVRTYSFSASARRGLHSRPTTHSDAALLAYGACVPLRKDKEEEKVSPLSVLVSVRLSGCAGVRH